MDTMLSKALREFNSGPLKQLLVNLGGEDGEEWERQLKLFLRKEPCWASGEIAQAPAPKPITDIRKEWQKFYRKYFRMAVDFSEVAIPEDSSGFFARVIFIPKGLTFARVVKALRKKFKVSLYVEDLDKDVTENVRTPSQSYAVRFRERQEADEELKSLSANQLKEQDSNSNTLMERLVFELKYWSETGQHLDINNVTLCAGSRLSVGNVPEVCWRSVFCWLYVDRCPPGSAYGSLRSRQAVSNK